MFKNQEEYEAWKADKMKPKPKTEPEPKMEAKLTVKKCPYCAEEILIDAIKCKHCGEFLNQKNSQAVQTVELTSKHWKGAQLLGFGMGCVGIILIFGYPVFGFLVVLSGIFTFIYGRVGAWWNHA